MLAYIFMPGGSEWILIVAAIAIVFGATRIPQLMRGMGQGIKEFKQAVREDEPAPKAGGETSAAEPPANGDAAPKAQ